MLSTYCQECGSKNEYRFDKPKFCSSCGAPLSLNVSRSPEGPAVKARESKRIESDFDEEGTEVYEVPDISELQYDIEISNSSFSLGSLFKNVESESQPIQQKRKRGRPRKNGKA